MLSQTASNCERLDTQASPSTVLCLQSTVPQSCSSAASSEHFQLISMPRLAALPSMQLAEASSAAAPGDMELNKAAKKASRKLKDLLEQDQYEEVYSGALDGLSGSDIAPVVEELENVVSGLVRFFTETLPGLAGSIFRAAGTDGPVMGSSSLTQGWLTGGLDLAQLAQPQQPLAKASTSPSDRAGSQSGVESKAEQAHGLHSAALQAGHFGGSIGMSSSAADSIQPGLLQVAMPLSSSLFQADIGFTAAATNAVTAAVTVNNQVENMLGPLRQAAADMRSLVSQIAELAASIDKYESAAQVDRESLAKSADALHSILGTATDSVSRTGSGLPALIAQLQTAVGQLRDTGSGNAKADVANFDRVVKTLESAVAALSDASVSLDVREPLEVAEETVEKEVTSEQALTEPVAEVAERAVDSAVQGIERAVGRLQDALSELDAAVSAARGFPTDSAPSLRN